MEKMIPANGLLVSDQAVVWPPRMGGAVKFRELHVVERVCLKIAIKASHHNVY
jgi:hypothetical protein